MVVGPVVDTVLQRVRDPKGVTASREFVRRRLSDAQRLLNARFGWILDETPLVTEPRRLFYPVNALLPEGAFPRFVRQGTRNLVYTRWSTFFGVARGWPRAVGPQFELWSMVGKDLLIVWPGVRTATTLTVDSARLTAPFANDADPFDVPDDMVPMVVDLAVALTALKTRDLAPMAEVISSLTGRLKERQLAP